MAETVRQVEYFYVEVPHRVGEGQNILRALKNAGVNLLAFSGFPAGRGAQMDFVPEDAAGAVTFDDAEREVAQHLADPCGLEADDDHQLFDAARERGAGRAADERLAMEGGELLGQGVTEAGGGAGGERPRSPSSGGGPTASCSDGGA